VACGDHYFLLEPQGDNRVRVRHNEEYSGLIVPTRLPPVYNTLRSAYEGFNHALKQWVESRA
jgi:hypothetical protein